MHERVGTDDEGREVLVRSHTGTVTGVHEVHDIGRPARLEVTIAVDPPDDRPGGFSFPVRATLDPDDPLCEVAAEAVGKPVRWIVEWRREDGVDAATPIRDAYLRDRARPVLVTLDLLADWAWEVPDTLPRDWS